MTKGEILSSLGAHLDSACDAEFKNDDDAWYQAMTALRDIAWEGKELIHEKRMAEAAAKGLNVFGRPYAIRKGDSQKSKPQLSKEELDALMKDLGL